MYLGVKAFVTQQSEIVWNYGRIEAERGSRTVLCVSVPLFCVGRELLPITRKVTSPTLCPAGNRGPKDWPNELETLCPSPSSYSTYFFPKAFNYYYMCEYVFRFFFCYNSQWKKLTVVRCMRCKNSVKMTTTLYSELVNQKTKMYRTSFPCLFLFVLPSITIVYLVLEHFLRSSNFSQETVTTQFSNMTSSVTCTLAIQKFYSVFADKG